MVAMARRLAGGLSACAALVAALTLLSGCYGPGAYPTMPPEAPEAPLDQASRGEKLYADGCAGCHGERGEGAEGRPALIGENALPLSPPPEAQTRKTELRTAKDLFDFTKADMPPMAPGTLSDDEGWAIIAFLVKSNGTALPSGGDIGPKNAASINIHPTAK